MALQPMYIRLLKNIVSGKITKISLGSIITFLILQINWGQTEIWQTNNESGKISRKNNHNKRQNPK